MESVFDEFLRKTTRNIHCVDRSGESALFIAVRTGQQRVTRRLLHAEARYDIENYAAVSLLSAARDELRRAAKQDTDDATLRYCDILVCMTTVLDFDAGIPLPRAGHRFRGEDAP